MLHNPYLRALYNLQRLKSLHSAMQEDYCNAKERLPTHSCFPLAFGLYEVDAHEVEM